MTNIITPYASFDNQSKGRFFKEPEAVDRSPFQRDRDRIIHSGAFRRLKSKTQVFVYHEGEDYRTRLTHSLEVSQIATSIARNLGLNEDLTDAIALSHDLGHAPFGHAGETVLMEKMQNFGGFSHNVQSFRLVTSGEQKYAEFDGLNLTWETLEGLVKHNGKFSGQVPKEIADYDKKISFELNKYASAEAQVAGISDDIAYNNHDLQDGVKAGLLNLDELAQLPLVGDALRAVKQKYEGLQTHRLIHETVRRIIDAMIKDVVSNTQMKAKEFALKTADDVRALSEPLVSFSPKMEENNQALKQFLFTKMYRHHQVLRMTLKSSKALGELFDLLFEHPQLLPAGLINEAEPNQNKLAQTICDYISGMTDPYFIEEYTKLFDVKVRP